MDEFYCECHGMRTNGSLCCVTHRECFKKTSKREAFIGGAWQAYATADDLKEWNRIEGTAYNYSPAQWYSGPQEAQEAYRVMTEYNRSMVERYIR